LLGDVRNKNVFGSKGLHLGIDHATSIIGGIHVVRCVEGDSNSIFHPRKYLSNVFNV
jgi:hypothetical protein